MSDSMDLISKESVKQDKSENEIFKGILYKRIYKILNDHRCTVKELKEIFEGDIYSSSTQNEMNLVFREIKEVHKIPLEELVLYLENYSDVKKIISFFDEESLWLLKKEMSEKYCIGIESNDLLNIME